MILAASDSAVTDHPSISGWKSPISGRTLVAESAFCLSDGAGERWPVVEGIPYLRAGSRDRAQQVLVALQCGDANAALCLLLAENDAWWDEPPPSDDDLHHLLRERSRLTLREAMALLGYGRVGDYFAYRWSDPTYVAGLALMDAHWNSPTTAFELACGIGHYLRELDRVGVATIGADVVFSKLWVARNWVVGPRPILVCFDAEHDWPIAPRVDLALCHDAFYFFRNKAAIASRLRSSATNGRLAIAHVHNAAANNHSGAASINLPDLLALFPDAVVYDDAELTLAGSEVRMPVAGNALEKVAAFSLVSDGHPIKTMPPARRAAGPLSQPAQGTMLRRNPLCAGESIAWPSPRYAQEYANFVTWRCAVDLPDRARMSQEYERAAACRELLDLPERW